MRLEGVEGMEIWLGKVGKYSQYGVRSREEREKTRLGCDGSHGIVLRTRRGKGKEKVRRISSNL